MRLVFVVALFGGCALTAQGAEFSRGELSRALVALLDSSVLEQYYHADAFPERFPLQVVDRAGVGFAEGAVEGAAVAAVVVAAGGVPDSSRAELVVDQVGMVGADVLMEFRFPAEGLSGKATIFLPGGAGARIKTLQLNEY